MDRYREIEITVNMPSYLIDFLDAVAAWKVCSRQQALVYCVEQYSEESDGFFDHVQPSIIGLAMKRAREQWEERLAGEKTERDEDMK